MRRRLSQLMKSVAAQGDPKESLDVQLDPFIDSIPAIRWNTEIQEFNLDVSDHSTSDAGRLLSQLGIVTLKSNFSRPALLQFAEDVLEFGQEVAGHPPSASPNFRMGKADDTYGDLEKSDIPVVNVRGGVDAGMVDIFHADKLFDPIMSEIRESITQSGVLEIIREASRGTVVASNQNIYINQSVTKTRGLHVDSYGGNQYKIFIYFTDVLSLDDGPYCYAPTSHRLDNLERINRAVAEAFGRKSTDIALCPPQLPMGVLAQSGTIIVSNQSGAHRGFPQSPGARRVIGALNCRVTD